MRDFTITIDIDAPPARVWAVMADVERWHEWTASITKVVLLDRGPLRIGQRARIKQPGFPRALWTVTELEEGRRFTWVSPTPGMVAIGRHEVIPRNGGSRATLAVRFDGPLGGIVGRLMRNVNNRFLSLEANGLKARSERTFPQGNQQ